VAVNAGTLALAGSGSVANSPTLQVAAGATLDVSGLTGGANFDGTRFQLAANQTLRGSGTIQGSMAVGPAGTLAPGTPGAPGALTVTRDLILQSTGTFTPKLQGTTPGTGHDQVLVNGAVTIANANLTVSVGGGYPPANTDKLFILVKGGSDPIVGQFNNLPEGATVAVGSQFQASISYLGDFGSGSLTGGNDVVLYNFAVAVPEPG